MSLDNPVFLAFLILLGVPAWSRCAFSQSDSFLPFPYDGDPFPINYTMEACKEYLGHDVCCNQPNALLTAANFIQVDGAFATASGGCDICAINLKRFWCQYACSPRQADFVKVSKEYYTYPDPQKPGKTIRAQEVNLTVQASTACALYKSCKRVPFVTSVSAMGSPAGFLNFQGHNALDNARQYINIVFTYDKKGLYFGNDSGRKQTADLTGCNFTEKELHGFEVKEACTCNSCQQACDASKGFYYTEGSGLEGFNWVLVVCAYLLVGIASGSVTYYRYWKKNQKQE